MNRGVIIIALGKPQYGSMAFNLGLSIKQIDPSAKVKIIHSGGSLNHINRKFWDKAFDDDQHVDMGYVSFNNKTIWHRAKMFADLLSPYDETIYIDADSLNHPQKLHVGRDNRLSCLFNDLNKIDGNGNSPDIQFCTQAEVLCTEMKGDDWTGEGLQSVVKFFAINPDNYYYHIQSSLFYWRKSEISTQFFALAREIFDSLELNEFTEYSRWYNSVPDELAFSIAAAKLGLRMRNRFLPVWFDWLERYSEKVQQKYYFLSLPKTQVEAHVIEKYDRLAQGYNYRIGNNYIYQYQNKADWL